MNSLTIAKRTILKQLEKKIGNQSENESLRTMTRFYVKIPLSSVHLYHPLGAAAMIGQYVDKRVVQKVYDLVELSITNVGEVKRSLDQFVESEIFGEVPDSKKPRKTNRKYYPCRKDIRNHIARAISSLKYSSDDQESLRHKVDDRRKKSPHSKYFYRARGAPHDATKDTDSATEKTFLFVHQEPWQQRLLDRYGSKLVLMDATYKTTMYAIPLFFVCVHTNVGYKVVAEFMCQTEDQASISEALAILRGWNPTWNPDFFMVDYSTAEIGAIENQFPGSVVYICDFHRIQALQRWVRTKKNNLSSAEQEMFLGYMQSIAYSRSEDEFNKRVDALRKSHLYKDHANVKSYVENTWLSCAFRWAQAFRKQQAMNIVNTNNGTEAQNKLFKYEYLPRSMDKSVYGIVTILVESFIPDSYQHYLENNLKFSSAYGRYISTVPLYLHNRPPKFVKHCLRSRFQAGEYQDGDVLPVNFQKGECHVKSSSKSNQKHLVQLTIPTCTCEAWQKSQYPCKHFFAVFAAYQEWDFSSLPEEYKNSVFITLDTAHLDINVPVPTKPQDASQPDFQPAQQDTTGGSTVHAKQDVLSECISETSDIRENSLSPENTTDTGADQTTTESVKKDQPLHSTRLRKNLQEQLNAVKDISFLVDDGNILKEAIMGIRAVYDMLLKSCPNNDGLPLRNSPVKKKFKPNKVEYHQVFHKKLPKRRKWRKKILGRTVVIDEVGGPQVKKEVL